MLFLAYFFVPLPQALALPDGFQFEARRHPQLDDFRAKERADDTLESTYSVELRTVVASLKFHHSTIEPADTLGVDELLMVATRALRLGQANLGNSLDEPARPLRDTTIVEMMIPLQSDGEVDLSEGFDRGLQAIRAFQRGYYVVRRRPLKLVHREKLPAFIPFAIRQIVTDDDVPPDGLSLIWVNTNIEPLSRSEVLSKAEIDVLRTALDAQPGARVFASFLDLSRHADNALQIDGDYKAAALFSAIAAEVLLDDLLAHFLWEEAKRPEEAAPILDVPLIKRVKAEFHPRIGGSGWNFDRPGPVFDWKAKVAGLRHRVVHGAYDPSRSEAEASVGALHELQRYIATLLLSPRALKKYARTALSFLGRASVTEAGRWNDALEALQRNPSEPIWGPTFVRWKECMQRWRIDPPPGERPAAETALSVAVIHPGLKTVWVLHHPNCAKACLADTPVYITSEQQQALTNMIADHSDAPSPVSVMFEGVRLRQKAQSEWVDDYRLVPMFGVMVDGNDLDPVV